MSTRQLGGLQKQALHLYREVLRVARSKADNKADVQKLARSQFDQYRHLSRKDFIRIEHLLRRGKRQLELLKQSDVTGAHIRSPPPTS